MPPKAIRGWANLSLRTKGLMIASLPVCALMLATTLAGRFLWEKNQAERRLAQTLEIRAQLQNMIISLISAESQVRNYALTGREEGLVQFGVVGTSLDALFRKVEDLIHDRPAQREQLAQFQQHVRQRLDGLRDLRAYYESHPALSQPAPAEIVNRAKVSPGLIVELTNLFTNEGPLLQEEMKNSAARQAWLLSAIVASVVTGLLGGVLAALLFAKATARRIQKLEKSASDMEQGTSPGMVLSGNDELGRLAAAMERAGQTLAGQSEKLKLALQGADILIWELETESGRIRYQGGSGTSRIANFPPELLPDNVDRWIAVVHMEDRDRVRQELNRIVAEGGSFQIEYRVVICGGEIRWMTVIARSHALGTTGERRLLGVLSDITARKKASEEIDRQAQELIDSRGALQQQTRILQSILDSMGDGVVVADTSGKFLVFNPAARQILGSRAFAGDPDEWAGHYGLFLPDMVSLYPTKQLPFLRAIRGESVDGAEIFARPAGATEGNWVSVTARPLKQDDGEIRGGVMVMRNITAARRAAEALSLAKQEADDANQAKSEFLSRMSHELRTPLNSILGFAQLLELGNLTEQQADNIRHILKGGYHLLELINEILDLARIESGRLSLSSEPVSIREVLTDALDIVRPLAVQQNVSLTSEGAVRCDRHVQADRQRLKQVILNLLSNAIKYNRTGGSVIVGCHELPGDKLQVEIVDTGMGISKDGIRKLFKPFERLESDQTEVSGTGLGLVVSKRLVEAMGGSIGVDSAVGVGSRFFVELAMIADPATCLETESVKGALAAASLLPQQGTVLYIEDNSSNLRLVEQILSHRPGIRLLSAMQGQLGLDLAELHSPEWILLDVHLPDIPGEEVLRRLRLNPRTRNIPVTILSADATAGQITRLMDAGARDYLTKPLDVRRLLSLLEETLRADQSGEQQLSSVYANRDHSE
jgi:signal transduction histidine kinase/FixJ family two-component response regulator/CHASE3 domain sensor protein